MPIKISDTLLKVYTVRLARIQVIAQKGGKGEYWRLVTSKLHSLIALSVPSLPLLRHGALGGHLLLLGRSRKLLFRRRVVVRVSAVSPSVRDRQSAHQLIYSFPFSVRSSFTSFVVRRLTCPLFCLKVWEIAVILHRKSLAKAIHITHINLLLSNLVCSLKINFKFFKHQILMKLTIVMQFPC